MPISGPARNRLQVEDRKAREHLQSDDGWPLTQSTGQGRGPVIAYGPAKGWSVQLAWRIVGPYVPYNAKVRQTNSHCRMGVSGGRELMSAVALLKRIGGLPYHAPIPVGGAPPPDRTGAIITLACDQPPLSTLLRQRSAD